MLLERHCACWLHSFSQHFHGVTKIILGPGAVMAKEAAPCPASYGGGPRVCF